MSRAEEIANGLGGAKKTPEGYVCKCPCHDDKSASLSLKVSDKGGIILNCFAGCRWEDIKTEIERRGLLKKNSTSDNYPKKSSQYNKYDGAKFYVYKDLVGNILCRKVKLPNKKMWFERYEKGSWIPKLEGLTIPLYNLQNVIESDTIYLCEGEKDAETLINSGLCGTTNHAGATSWANHLTEQLKNKTVIVIPDNDEAGRKRVAMLGKSLQGSVKELRVFIPDGVPEHGDITDWVNNGGDLAEVFKKSVVIEKSKQQKSAPIEDYFELFDTIWNHPRKCLFSEKLMRWDSHAGFWTPCINSLSLIKSHALVANELRESKFSLTAIEHHFVAYEAMKMPELLVDIPEWDFTERIKAMAGLVKLKPDAGITQDAWAELLMEWCSLVFERLENPKVQNRILILQGAQGIGKDTWTDMLVDGLGQFCVPLNVVAGDKDTFLSLHDGLVMKISEYDKTSKTEVSTLKDMITTPKTMLRGAYERERRPRVARCSFISSANVNDLLRDHTGSRRYMIIEIDSIEYAYSGWDDEKVKEWQLQCLAEMKHLAGMRYRASVEAHRQMRVYLDGKTPGDMAEDAIELFIQRLRTSEISFSNGEIRISPNDNRVVSVLASIAKDMGVKIRTVRNMISSKLMIQTKVGNSRPRILVIPPEPVANYGQGTIFENSNTSSEGDYFESSDQEEIPF